MAYSAEHSSRPNIVFVLFDDIGFFVEDDEVSVSAFHATVGYAAGLNIEKTTISPSGRPITVGDGEKPVMELFA